MYEELVNSLRICGDSADPIAECCYEDCVEHECPINPLCMQALYNKAADAIEELSKPRWIPVTEKLPEGADESGAICENVWLFFDDGGVFPGWMNGRTGKVYYLDDLNDVVMKAPISRVKMWQPRPEPPKEES